MLSLQRTTFAAIRPFGLTAYVLIVAPLCEYTLFSEPPEYGTRTSAFAQDPVSRRKYTYCPTWRGWSTPPPGCTVVKNRWREPSLVRKTPMRCCETATKVDGAEPPFALVLALELGLRIAVSAQRSCSIR